MKRNPIRLALEAAVASGYLTAEAAAEIEEKSDARKKSKSESDVRTTAAMNDKDTLFTLDRDLDHAKHRLANLASIDTSELVSIAIEVRDCLKRGWKSGSSRVNKHLFVYDRELGNAFDFLEALDVVGGNSRQVIALLLLNRCLLIDIQQLCVFRDAIGTSEQELVDVRKAFQEALTKSQEFDIAPFSASNNVREV